MIKVKSREMNDDRPLAISYLRYSTPEQQQGDSFRRQLEASQAYAGQHGLRLDEKIYQDLGVSAFRGKNSQVGALRSIQDSADAGDFPVGTHLLVESMDRLSRAIPRKAVRVLEDICEAGITVVTLDDGQVYTQKRLDDEPLAFMLAYLVAIRANEESVKKGRRVSEAWAEKRRRASTEKLTAWCPQWLYLDADRENFEAHEDRAKIVLRIFQEAHTGKGQEAIAKMLNLEEVETFGRAGRWHKSTIAKILRNAAVIGRYQPHKMADGGNGKRIRVPDGDPVENYFPPIIPVQLFVDIQARFDGTRATYKRGSAPVANPLAGLARCGDCGASMTRVTKGSSKRAGKAYLVCSRAKVGGGCQYHTIPQSDVEEALTANSASWISEAPIGNETSRSELKQIDAERVGLEHIIERYIEQIATSGPSPVIGQKLRDAEAAKIDIEARWRALSSRVVDQTSAVLKARLEALESALNSPVFDPETVNLRMKETLASVTVEIGKKEDMSASSLIFHWLQGGQTTTALGFGSIMY